MVMCALSMDVLGRALSTCLPAKQRMLTDHQRRIMRRIKHGDRMRLLQNWQDIAAVQRELLRKLRTAAASLRNRPVRNGYNSWKEMSASRHYKKDRMTNALHSFTNAAARKCFNTWVEVSQAVSSQLAKVRAAAVRFSPNGRKLARAMTSLAESARSENKRRQVALGVQPQTPS